MMLNDKPDLRIFHDYDVTVIHKYLSEEQNTAVLKLREALPQKHLDEDAKQWCTDATLCRFLRARDWDHAKALTMITNTLAWRAQYNPHKITAEDVLCELKNSGKMYRSGFDKYGRPILYMKPGLDNTGAPEREQKVRYLCYLLEKCALVAAKNKKEKLLLIIDFKGNSQINGLLNIKISQEVLQVLQDHYPETLGVAMIYNSPWTFHFFWSCISPFMHPITREKVRMVNHQKEFLEFIDPKELETTYGGLNTFKYNFEEHWNKEDLEFPVVKKNA